MDRLLIQFDEDTRIKHDGKLQWIIERRTGKSCTNKQHFVRTKIGLEQNLTERQMEQLAELHGGDGTPRPSGQRLFDYPAAASRA